MLHCLLYLYQWLGAVRVLQLLIITVLQFDAKNLDILLLWVKKGCAVLKGSLEKVQGMF